MTVRLTATTNITTTARLYSPSVSQAVLADATLLTWVVPAAGTIYLTQQFVGTHVTGAGGLEKTEVDVTKNGATILTAKTLINAAAGTAVVDGTLIGGTCAVVKGDKIAIVNDYTVDGGGGDTGAALTVSVHYQAT